MTGLLHQLDADFLPQFLTGMTVNFEIAAVALALGLALGLMLAWARVGGGAAGVGAASIIGLMRAAPTFVVMFFLLNAIPRGQNESALALGFSPSETMRTIILPQVFRIVLPAVTNEAISTLKNTSLLSTITVVELTLYAQTLIAATFRPFEFYIAVAIIYLVLTTILTFVASWLERRYANLG